MTTFWLMTPAMTATMETLGCRSCLLRPGCRSKTPCILKSPDAQCRESRDRHASARHVSALAFKSTREQADRRAGYCGTGLVRLTEERLRDRETEKLIVNKIALQNQINRGIMFSLRLKGFERGWGWWGAEINIAIGIYEMLAHRATS